MATKRAAHGADEEADALYALPASEFVAARNALVKQLKGDGRKDEAAEVAALRKPSVVAWALNQVARDDPDAVSILIDAAAGVADAQKAVMEGGDAKALRAASAAQRGAAAEVLEPAVRHAGANNADAVRTTLDAALADGELTEQLRAGTLTETLDAPAGFGFGFAGGDAPTTPRRRSSGGQGRKAVPAKGAKEKGSGASPTDELAERRARAEAARAAAKEVARLEKELARADKAVASATAAHDDAAGALEEAEAQLVAAQERVEQATAARDDAEVTVDEATRVRDEVASALDDARDA